MPAISVLLVEDNETEAAQTRSMLIESESTTFHVDWVGTADEALAQMLQGGHDVCLVDVALGDASGIDVMMRAIDGGCQTPIVLLANFGAATQEEEAFAAGATDYLVKGESTAPMMQRALRHAVERGRVAAALRESEARLVQAERMESLGRLAGGIAHDFNNLLTGILGYTSLLERDFEPDHPSRESIDAIRRSSELASRLTRQLLAYSRKQALNPLPLDLNHVVEGLGEMLRRLLSEHLTFDLQLAADLPAVTGDRAQMEQVVMNLVLNARDATPPGGRIMVSTGAAFISEADAAIEGIERPGRYVVLAVEDTGEGMPPEVLDRIFEPFFTTKPGGAGTGLGLASAYGIVQQSGGFMRAASRTGAGTRISVYLPASARAAQPVTLAGHPTTGSETVLVVEDEHTVRRYIGDTLTRFGYRPVLAESPNEALAIVAGAAAPLSLVLTDIVLPEMSGMHLAQRLTKLQPGLKVVFMSGYIDPRTGHAALPANASFLRKPFPPDELARVVRRVLDGA
jgi:two-component system cell cycle sensor histidine kinase/response regulator CckA